MNQNISQSRAAKRLNKSVETIVNWCNSGYLHSTERLSGDITVRAKDIEKLEKRLGKKRTTTTPSKPPIGLQKPNPRLILLLTDTQPARNTVPLLERFLRTNGIEISFYREHKVEELLELVLCGCRSNDIRWAGKLIHDLFRETVVSISIKI